MSTQAKKRGLNIIYRSLIFLALLFLLYYYPLQRYLAINKFNDYTAKQGVTQEDISERKVFKNYKDGGYTILVKYKGQDRYHYGYDYHVYTHKKNEDFRWNRMFCNVNDLQTGKHLSSPYPKDLKYPPLKTE
ncbi:MAG: DUF3139 domain-containing protein [Eubacteriales bacterium]|nr:DUF3139 domain-containing protein [Eubacteriales bacterium]